MVAVAPGPVDVTGYAAYLRQFFTSVRGMSNTDIARELFLGDATIKTHVARIFSKLRLHDRAQAVVLACETGLVQPGGRETPHS